MQESSERYDHLISQYQIMHETAGMFDGKSLAPHIDHIKALIDKHNVKTVLDYGCGKAKLHDEAAAAWGVKEIDKYDPAYEPYSAVPTGRYDLVICTDVLEHCDKGDIDWILDEIKGLSRKAVYIAVAAYPAAKTLPNGENAHCTIEGVDWWRQIVSEGQESALGLDLKLAVSVPK